MHATVARMETVETIPSSALHRIARAEFHRMWKAGCFPKGKRIELLRGVLVDMGKEGEPHVRIRSWLGTQLVLALDHRAHEVRQEGPIAAAEDSEPQPDVAVHVHEGRDELPRHALLVIEVSQSSLRIDRGIKQALYAELGIPEYWIVDVEAETVEVYTLPAGPQYGRVEILRAGDLLRPATLPRVAFAVAEIPFRPRRA